MGQLRGLLGFGIFQACFLEKGAEIPLEVC